MSGSRYSIWVPHRAFDELRDALAEAIWTDTVVRVTDNNTSRTLWQTSDQVSTSSLDLEDLAEEIEETTRRLPRCGICQTNPAAYLMYTRMAGTGAHYMSLCKQCTDKNKVHAARVCDKVIIFTIDFAEVVTTDRKEEYND